MPKVLVPEPYRGPTHGVGDVPVEGTDVGECLRAVETKFPGFEAQVVDGDGRPHRFVKLFLNGDPLDPQAALGTSVGPDDVVEILAAIGGGSGSRPDTPLW